MSQLHASICTFGIGISEFRDRSTLTENESERDEQGQFAEQTSDDDILRVIRESEFPAVTARWVADTVAMERWPVHQRFEELHELGKLERGGN